MRGTGTYADIEGEGPFFTSKFEGDVVSHLVAICIGQVILLP